MEEWAGPGHKANYNNPLTYLTDSGKRDLIAGEAERLSVLRPVLLPSEPNVASQTAEMVDVPVLVFCSSVLTT